MSDANNGSIPQSSTESGTANVMVDNELDSKQVLPMSLNSLDSISEQSKVPAHKIMRAVSLPLEKLFDVPISLAFEVGRTKITIKDLMELKENSFIELRQVSVDSIDVLMDGKVIAKAETLALQQRYGIRFGEMEEISKLDQNDESLSV